MSPGRPSRPVARVQRVRSCPLLCLLVKPLDIRLELLAVDAPHASSAELDRRQAPRANQRIYLRNAHLEVGRHVLKREKTRLYIRVGHLRRVAPEPPRYLDSSSFAFV
jgi:hypothetical protein